MLFLLKDSPHKIKLEKVHGALILFFVSPSSPPPQSRSKENAKIVSKNSTKKKLQFQGRIWFFIKNTKKQPLFSKRLVEKYQI